MIMIQKRLGKIQEIVMGFGGYDNAMFGVNFSLGGEEWTTTDFWGTWASRAENAGYTVEAWDKCHADTIRGLCRLMREAKVKDVSGLKGVPIEVEFHNNVLKTWRVLKEVL